MPNQTMTRIVLGIIALAGLAVVAWLAMSGGPRQSVVRGAVTYKGQPVKAGTIRFTPLGNGSSPRPMLSGSIKDGRYEIRVAAGSHGGTYRVTVSGFTGIPKQRGPITDPLGERLGPDSESIAELPCLDCEYDAKCD